MEFYRGNKKFNSQGHGMPGDERYVNWENLCIQFLSYNFLYTSNFFVISNSGSVGRGDNRRLFTCW